MKGLLERDDRQPERRPQMTGKARGKEEDTILFVWSRLRAAILDSSPKYTPDHNTVVSNGFLALKSVTTHVLCTVARHFDENII